MSKDFFYPYMSLSLCNEFGTLVRQVNMMLLSHLTNCIALRFIA